jgi:hypothetical protein
MLIGLSWLLPMFMVTNFHPSSSTATVNTQISKCLTVEFNPIPRFLFHPTVR